MNNGYNADGTKIAIAFRHCLEDFLSPYGYKMIEQRPYFVRYANDFTFLTFSFSPTSHEIDMRWGKLSEDTDSSEDFIPYLHLARYLSGDSEAGRFLLVAHSAIEFEVANRKIIETLSRYGAKLFNGDDDLSSTLDAYSRQCSRKYMADLDLKYDRPIAEKAWIEGHHATVIKLFAPHEEFLTPEEQMRLKVCREKLASGSTEKTE